ncbi:glycerophosphodiester phosphodiesterase [Methanocalculus taiwanensis]|uniref:Glycerophosphodiester phosphodiesterase n=1 Tax=Methanocalculus taiwanensis TaxID=106207 RepID=A0ABD4TLA1_9EURY|nr:glycerophosphodiester phosphodiesterase family protein [Methanocalculus taiwanensis]MCQ1538548.1 glycerophosphodiester phosphodiesterase [Methanocalculus taiwanensis]
MIIIGHRGARATRPENTIAALREGSRWSDYVEIDVRISRDGVPVVIHDPTLDRTTDGTGFVRDYTLAELKALDAGEGERIPTLAEVLALDIGECGLVIELKEGGYEEQVATLVEEAGLSKVLIVSFDADCLRRIALQLPDAGIGYIFRSPGADPVRVAASIPASYILLRFIDMTEELRDLSQRADLNVIVWTLNSDKAYAEASKIGVEGVVTDDPSSAWSFFCSLRNVRDAEKDPFDS